MTWRSTTLVALMTAILCLAPAAALADPAATYTFTVSAGPPELGKVTGPGIDCGLGATDCSETYPAGTVISVEVHAQGETEDEYVVGAGAFDFYTTPCDLSACVMDADHELLVQFIWVSKPPAPPGSNFPPLKLSPPPNACPEGSTSAINSKRLVGKRVRRARELARKYGCTVRVVRRNGQDLPVTKDFSTARANVAMRRGRVVKVVGIF